MSKLRGNHIRTIASLSISLVCVTLIIWNVDWNEIKSSFSRFDAVFLLPAVLIYLSSFLVRALRWQIFLREIKNISYFLNLEVIMLGWAANNLLPARLGEVVRAYAMGTKAQISRSASLATILVERIYDGLVLLAFLLFLLIYTDFPDWVTKLAWAGIVLFGGIFIFLLLLQKYRDFILTHLTNILGRISLRLRDAAVTFIQKFVTGLNILSNPAEQVVILLLTLAVWLIEVGVYYIVIRGFHIALPVEGIIFTLIIINMGILIPSSPGYIGTFQFFAILALGIFGITSGTALSFAIVLHAVQYFPVTLAGIIVMNRMGLSFKELQNTA